MVLEVVTPEGQGPQRKRRLGIGWQVSVWSGWGVYGLNLILQLAAKGEWDPILLHPPIESGILNPVHRWFLQPVFDRHAEFMRLLESHAGKTLECPFPVLHPLGNHLDEDPTTRRVHGDPNVGVVFFEDSAINAAGRAAATTFDLIVAGSTWNAHRLQAHGISHVRVVLQGVDLTIFHPAPRSRPFGDRFVIFSGGKLEYRKAQDVVVAAYRTFRSRHPEALLVTAWHNPWPPSIQPFDVVGHVSGLPATSADGRLRIGDWLQSNGLPSDSYIDPGPVPNWAMGEVLREADVAVFPNRCEGGTNLVAMEAMSCGLPTVLSANTGHMDLIADDVCYALREQSPVAHVRGTTSVEGWGESSVDELVDHLERVFHDRSEAQRRGAAAARMMEDWSWGAQVGRLLQALDERPSPAPTLDVGP